MTHSPSSDWQQRFRSDDAEVRYRALQAIAAAGDDDIALPYLRQALDDADSSVRAGAARILWGYAARHPRPNDETIWRSIEHRWQQLLQDDDPDVRFESARGLLRINSVGDAADVLLALLNDAETHPAMIVAVLKSLGDAKRPRSASELDWSRFLQHPQADVREQAARLLGEWEVAELATPLIPLLDDEEPFVREEAAKSLGQIGVASPEIIAALTQAASDEDELVAAAARESLARLQESQS